MTKRMYIVYLAMQTNFPKTEGNNVKPNLNAVVVMISTSVSLSINLTKAVIDPAIRDFVVLKAFNINTHHPNAPKIMEVFWHPPIINWVKCNTDATSLGNPGSAACVGIFRNS